MTERPDSAATTADELRRINELLTLENRSLRAHLAGGDGGERIARPDQVVMDAAEADELTQARSDLRWVLERIARSPAGPALRRRKGFSRLYRTWLE